MKRYLRAVARYGANGTFWSENPMVPDKPVKAWQIWNEPNFKYFVAKPNPTEYGKLVKLSSTAIKSVDPSAQIVLAGLFAKPAGARYLKGKKVVHATSPNFFGSYFLEQMYKTNAGIKSSFQGVALHPYVARYRQLPAEIEELRGVMTREGDAAKGLWVTELGWSSEAPQGPSNVFAVGTSGQARELKGAFTLLSQDAAKFRLKHVYWFSVAAVSLTSTAIWFLFVWMRSCLRSRAALVLARLASISSLRMRSRCFSALALWMCSTSARLCLKVLPLLRWQAQGFR